MSTFAIVGDVSGDLLTLGGRVIVHPDRSEMEFLFPLARIVRLSDGDNGPILQLKDHPSMAPVQWPLNPKDFQ